MKSFLEFINENDEKWYKERDWVKHEDGKYRPNREIHLVRDHRASIPTYKGRTDHDSGKAYAVLGQRTVDVVHHKGPEYMKNYHKSIAKDKGYSVHFHDE